MVKKNNIYRKTIFILTGTLLLLLCLMVIPGFCDFYTEKIYIHIADALGRFMGYIFFPLGEIMMYVGILLAIAAIIIFPFLCIKKWGMRFYRFFLVVLLVLGILYETNWLIPFFSSGIVMSNDTDRNYSIEELRNLREYLAININRCEREIARDEEGRIIISEDIEKKLKASIYKMGEEYPRLTHYIPPVKEAICSPVLEWMSIGGYTYPFTMEITCNKYNDKMIYQTLMAHEISHHLGYYKENDAEFLGDIICINSEDTLLQYAGYYFAFCYVDNDYWDNLLSICNGDRDLARKLYKKEVQLAAGVQSDRSFFKHESEELYKNDVSPKIENAFQAKAEEIANVGWEVQADILQDAIYSGVVKLMLQYYDGFLETK